MFRGDGFYRMFSVSWVQRNVNKPGHGSDLSKWCHLAVEMVNGDCRSDRKRTENMRPDLTK